MNCRKLKKIVNSDDPLNKLKQKVGNKSLKECLEIGFGVALRTSIAKNISDATKYLSIIDTIIPPVPVFMNNETHKIIFERSSTPNEDLEHLELLISTLGNVFFTMINNKMFPKDVGTQVLLKVVYYAGERTINDYFVKVELYHFIKTHLGQYCNDLAHTAMALISILLEKLPVVWLQMLFQPGIIASMKMIVSQNEHNSCLYLRYLEKQFHSLNLEEMFYEKLNTPQFIDEKENQDLYQALKKLNIAFKEKCLTEVLRTFAQIINENENIYQQFRLTGVMQNFHSLLCNPSEFGDNAFVIKSFLKVFLCFQNDTEDSYSWKSDLFEKLVKLAVFNLDYLLHNLNYVRNIIDAVVAVELLQALHVLNSTWHQWFDIAVQNKIIKDCMFESTVLRSKDFLISFRQERYLWNFLKICPALMSMERKSELFEYKHQGTKHFEISRGNLMNEMAEIFNLGKGILSYYWEISFKGEIGRGPGVTREVYSILSEELQKHYIGFWRDETIKGSDNEVILTQSPDEALPKSKEEIERFQLLGKIMAKAILDGQYLEIPLRTEIFRQLRIFPCKYSHLKRDYFDLIETFPVLEHLFKQLLPVKRKIEAIRSEVGLSEHQKKELISNLTFQDGNTFDDLCLNFTVPGTNIELIDGGHDVLLSPHNIDLYLEKLCAQNVQIYSARQFEAIKAGFYKILSHGSIDFLLPKEFEILIGGEEIQRWTEADLRRHCKYNDSLSVQYLFQCLASFDSNRQKLFLRFVTGRKCLPCGGLSGLKPPLTISRIKRENADSYLPSAATCFNRLFLPDYSNLSVTRQKFLYAIEEGNNSFAIV